MPAKNRNLVYKTKQEDGDTIGPFDSNTDVSVDIVVLHPNGKVGLTGDGGLCVKLTNATNLTSVKGWVVQASTSSNNAFQIGINAYDAIGCCYESGIPSGQQAWVVVSGIASVLLHNTSSRGGWIQPSTTQAGRGLEMTPPSGLGSLTQDMHFKEIGHCLEQFASGSDYLAKAIIHFN